MSFDRRARRLFRCSALGLIALCLCLGAAALPARAAGDATLFGGGQDDYAAFGFLGANVVVAGSNSNGIALQGDVFGGGYEYEKNSTTIKASFVGEEIDALYHISQPHFWNDTGVGLRNANTTLSPFDSGNRRHGDVSELTLSTEGGAIQGPWREDYYGSYGTRLADFYSRVSLTHSVSPATRLGLEGSLEGDPTYTIHRIGPYAGVELDKRSEIQLAGGVSDEIGRSPIGYIRASVNRSF